MTSALQVKCVAIINGVETGQIIFAKTLV